MYQAACDEKYIFQNVFYLICATGSSDFQVIYFFTVFWLHSLKKKKKLNGVQKRSTNGPKSQLYCSEGEEKTCYYHDISI